MPEKPEAPPKRVVEVAAAPIAAPGTQDIVLLEPYRHWRDGRVLLGVPDGVAQKLMSAKLARAATRRDKKISGSAAIPYTEEE